MKRKYLILFICIFAAATAALVVFQKQEGQNEGKSRGIYAGNFEPRIGYVELQVSNLDYSLKFYEELIGFKVLERDEKTAKLTTDGIVPQLLLKEEEVSVERPIRTTGLYHFAIVVPDRQDLALSFVHLLENDYPIQGAADHQYTEAIYLADPDNNGIEIYVDRDPNQWLRDENGYYIGGNAPLDMENLLAEIKDSQWDGLPTGTRIGHMHLQVSDIEESEKFYVDALGFDIVSKDTHMLFVSKDGYHHHIGLNTWLGTGLAKPPANALGLKYFTIQFIASEYRSARDKLDELGYNYKEENQEMTVEDPSGNHIKIVLKEK